MNFFDHKDLGNHLLQLCPKVVKHPVYVVVVGKPALKRLVKRRCRWEDNIKIHLREMGWERMDWTDLTVDRYQWHAVVNTVGSVWFP